MGDSTEIHPDQVSRAASGLTQVGQVFGDAFSKLKTTLAQHDGCWGDDDIGKGFAAKYVQPAQDCVTQADNAQQTVTGTAQQLSVVPDAFADVDDQNGQYLQGYGE